MHVIVVASSKGGAGKSTLSTNLAAHYALQDRRTFSESLALSMSRSSSIDFHGLARWSIRWQFAHIIARSQGKGRALKSIHLATRLDFSLIFLMHANSLYNLIW